jgi:ribosomal subunit interface protein
MKITYSQIEAELRKSVEEEFAHHVEKLNRLLTHYEDDGIKLHASLEKTPHRNEFNFSLNLTLPGEALHATGTGANVPNSAKVAFAELEAQVKKHQQKLRKDYLWKRKRGRPSLHLGEIPAAD